MNKIEVINISRDSENFTIRIGNAELEQIKQFKYLSSILRENAKCTKEIRLGTAIVKGIFQSRKNILKNSLNLKLKKRLNKYLIWTVEI